jgi:release factor glutamine methyltransferase
VKPVSVTVLEIIRKATEFLERKGIDSPRLQAELLLAHVLNVPRMELYLNFERLLTPAELDGFRESVSRRAKREPLQHILGTVSFCGLELICTPAALVPRPETELLAQMAWDFLGQLDDPMPCALDFGTGTGCLPIAIAAHCPKARLVALDVSPEAVALAKENAARHALLDKIDFLASDGFTELPSDARFNLIVSNPPYIARAEIGSLQPEVRDHDPRLALDGGDDGLDFYRRLATEAGAFLKPLGMIMLEFGDGQGPALREVFDRQKWVVEAVREDYSHRDRFLIARRP